MNEAFCCEWCLPAVQQVCPETNTVIINIGLLLLAFSNLDEERCRYLSSPHLQLHLPATRLTFALCFRCVCRPSTYHSNLQVSWDLNTGVCCTVGVGDLTAVRGQTRWATTAPLLSPCLCIRHNKRALSVLTVAACGALTGDPVSTRWWSGWSLKAARATLIAWPTKLYTKVRRLHLNPKHRPGRRSLEMIWRFIRTFLLAGASLQVLADSDRCTWIVLWRMKIKALQQRKSTQIHVGRLSSMECVPNLRKIFRDRCNIP